MYELIFTTRKPRRWRILQQDEWIGFEPETRGSPYPPMVFPIEPFHKIIMDRALQNLWFSLNRSGNWAADYKAWLNYTASNKAITNQSGIIASDSIGGEQMSIDFIGNTGLGLQFPKIGTYVSGREINRGEEVKLTERQGNLFPGTWAIRMHTIRPGYYRGITREKHPEVVHILKIFITDNLAPNGLRQVNADPARGGREGYPVYFPVISKTQMYYPREKVAKMLEDEPAPTPYNPP